MVLIAFRTLSSGETAIALQNEDPRSGNSGSKARDVA